jgi:hypothetical protein
VANKRMKLMTEEEMKERIVETNSEGVPPNGEKREILNDLNNADAKDKDSNEEDP